MEIPAREGMAGPPWYCVAGTATLQDVFVPACRVSFEDLFARATPSILLSRNAGGTNHFLICVGTDGNDLNLIDPLFVPFRKFSKDLFLLNTQRVAILTQFTPFTEYEDRIDRLATWTMSSSIFVFLSSAVVAYKRRMKSS